jgi:DNA mismatch repair protein MutS
MAGFEIDRQTIKDLDLFNEEDTSIYSFFNNVKTLGGRRRLKTMMETPSFDVEILSSRRDTIKFFHDKKLVLPVDKNELDFIEHYLTFNIDTLKPNVLDAYMKGIKYQLSPNKDYYTIAQGITDTRKLLKILAAFYNELSEIEDPPGAVSVIINALAVFLTKKEIQKSLQAGVKREFSYLEISYYYNLFRKVELINLQDILKIAYDLDMYIAIAKAVEIHAFCFPQYMVSDEPDINITGLYHPCIKDAVKNDVLIAPDKNVCFLTGANMAGKSSYLKALGLAIYLAHIGFPVPATQMKTTIFKGLITTINLADNISSGYSHYFNEVKRLRKVAETIAIQDNLFVIFDELFRGTNVKDAYDASLATITALSKIKNSVFLISTHIVEIAVELKPLENISYKFFDSKIENGKPVFDFKLKDGVSAETLGYFIFKNEGIIEILEQAAIKNKKIAID